MRYLMIIIMLCTLPGQLLAAKPTQREQSIASCRKLVASIERHETLRRRGGSIGKMESWKRRIREDQDAYTRLDCKRLRRYL